MESAPKEPPITLVFHPIDRADPPSTAFMDAARAVLSASEGPLRLVGPYLGHAVLDALIRGRRFRLVTDLDACFGVRADPALVALLEANLSSVRDLDAVHAKVLLSDGAALMGSANFTSPGFAGVTSSAA